MTTPITKPRIPATAMATTLRQPPTLTTWEPIDLTGAFTGPATRQTPQLGRRSDGQGLLYKGKTHSLAGESEAGKSWVALFCCAQEIDENNHVLYVDFEDDVDSVVSRLLTLGVTATHIQRYFTYVQPTAPLADAAAALVPEGTEFSLIVLDGVTELMSLYGFRPNDDVDVAEMQRLPRALADTGAAVVMLDHVVKDRQARGRYATGSQHKLSGITGAAYTLESVEPFAMNKPGRSRLVVTKDRPGGIRGQAVKARGDRHVIADFVMTVADGTSVFDLEPYGESATSWRPTDLMSEMSTVLEEKAPEGLSTNGLYACVGGRTSTKQAALRWLIEEGFVRVTVRGRSHMHHHVRSYEPADGPSSR